MDAASLVQKGVRSLGRAALDRVGSLGSRARDAADARRTVTIGRPPEEVFAFWRDPQRASQAFGGFGQLVATGPDRVRWSLRARDGGALEWETRVVEERPGELLRWLPVEGAAVDGEASVELRRAPGEQGTEATLHLRVAAPEGASATAALAPLALSADVVVLRAGRRAQALLEVGEAPTLEANPAGREAAAPATVARQEA
jgi:uncharacterized membrane protein